MADRPPPPPAGSGGVPNATARMENAMAATTPTAMPQIQKILRGILPEKDVRTSFAEDLIAAMPLACEGD